MMKMVGGMGVGAGLYLDRLLEGLKLFAARHGYSCSIEDSLERLEEPIYVAVCRDRYGIARRRLFLSRTLRDLRRRLLKGVDLELQVFSIIFRRATLAGLEELRIVYSVDRKRNLIVVGVEEPFRGWVEAVVIAVKVVSASRRKYGERDLRKWVEQLRSAVAKHFRGLPKRAFLAVYAPTTRFYSRHGEDTLIRRVLHREGIKLYRSLRELLREIWSFWTTRLERLRESIEGLRFRVYGRVEKLVRWLETAVRTLEEFWRPWLSRPPPIRAVEGGRDPHTLLYEARPADD